MRVEKCVENVCRKGCRAVWSDLAALESGQPLPEVRGLSPQEIRAVIHELRTVMSVYEGNCTPD